MLISYYLYLNRNPSSHGNPQTLRKSGIVIVATPVLELRGRGTVESGSGLGLPLNPKP